MQRKAHSASSRTTWSSMLVSFTQSSSTQRVPDTEAGDSQGGAELAPERNAGKGPSSHLLPPLPPGQRPSILYAMQNPDIARLFDAVADLLEIQDANPFRVRAYRNAARTIRDYPEPIADLVRAGTKDLTDIAGIGDDLAEKITAIVTSGELPLRKQLASKLPAGLLDLLRI